MGDAERLEGDLGSFDTVDLELSDEEIANAIGNRVTSAQSWWNTTLNLETRQKENEKYWIGETLDETGLYDYQSRYKEGRIFNAIETLIPMALSKPPEPIVTEAEDSDASRELAKSHHDYLLGMYEDGYYKTKLTSVVRHLLIGYRLGVLKVRHDKDVGDLNETGEPGGDIVVDVVRPQRVVIGERTKTIDSVRFVAEYLSDPIDVLAYRYPKKKDQILNKAGMSSKGVASQLSAHAGYLEVWFDYFDKTGKPRQAVVHKMDEVIMDGMKNPHWNYQTIAYDDQDKPYRTNFLSKPTMPYIFFQFLNLNKYIYDDTSLTEQAKNLQDILNKRGRQIVDNADTANSGLVYNTDMISEDNVSRLIGNPNEKVMASGRVQDAAARLPVNLLPPYVIEDKNDHRNQIDNTFGTHAPVRGEDSNSPTLGQEVMSQRADITRTMILASAIEDGADRLYKYITQMVRVTYTDPVDRNFPSQEGNTTFVKNYSMDTVKPGTKVRVKTGSVLPDDLVAKYQQTVQAIAILDPLSIAEGFNKPNPKEWATRMMLYRMAPDQYMSQILNIDPMAGGNDPSALQEIQLMNAGKEVPPQENPTKQHLATHQAFMDDPQFEQVPVEVQQLHVVHVRAEQENTKKGLGQEPAAATNDEGEPQAPPASSQEEPTPPTPEQPQQSPGIFGKIRKLIGGDSI